MGKVKFAYIMGDQGRGTLKTNGNNTLVTALLPSWFHETCPSLGFLTGFVRVLQSSDTEVNKLHMRFYDAFYDLF